ncbi:MAG: hypothetical protein AAB337_03810 [Patescibacteria group bacterium]
MTFPHQSFLDEFKIAINKLSVGVPNDIREQAQKLYNELVANPEATEEQIHDALVTVGKQEFAYRRAYEELVGHAGATELQAMVLDHVEPNVKEKIIKFLSDGISLTELLKSDVFEHDFTAEERYQIEDGLFDAQEHLQEHGPKMLEERRAEFDALVKKWQGHFSQMEEKIAELKALADKDKKWTAEILDKVKIFEEGWSVVERDTEPTEIEKEIEYWKGTIEA